MSKEDILMEAKVFIQIFRDEMQR